MRVLLLAAVLVSASLALAASASATPDASPAAGVLGGFGVAGESGPDGPSPIQRALIEQQLAQYREAHPEAPSIIQKYPFYPQGGTLWQDLFVENFTDLDPTGGVQDWDCSAYAYNGHTGHDSLIRSFREQGIGVPVFAALNGTVASFDDGHPDMNTSASGQPSNYVILDHGGGHRSFYFHLKNGSVAVWAPVVGQPVVAGQQIGLTASSGNSSWPHLHFESQHNNAWYEPSAGPCRTGESYWVNQVPIRRDLFARDFTISPNSYGGTNDPPYDQAIRTGTFVTGVRDIYPRLELGNLPANSTYRVRIRRPNSTDAVDFSGGFGNPFYRSGYFYWFITGVNMSPVGVWRVLLDINGSTVANAPFDVVSSAGQVVNRAPNAVTVSFDPAPLQNGKVVFCRVQTSLIFEDPDYDLVRYTYAWTVNGSGVRSNTFAGLADALRGDLVHTGDVVGCTVTPSDGLVSGPAASVSATVAGPTAVRVRSVTARASGRGVVVQWRTASEADLLGFNVYSERGGVRVRVNRALIPSVFGGTATGHAYRWVDRGARRGASLGYRLQAVSLSGARRWIGFATVAR